MAIVCANNLKFFYPGIEEPALEDVSFEIEDGEVLGIIGPLGAGKTTLCLIIAGLAPRIIGGDLSGELEVAGRDPQQPNHDEEDRPVGMVFEDYAGQLTQLKALDEVVTTLINRGVAEEEAENRARELLKQVGLSSEGIENQWIWELSGGQQQRLAIAAMLAIEPQILIFDSVMGKLDPQGQEQVGQIVRDLSDDKKTLVIVEQDPSLLLQTADRLMVLVDGHIEAIGKPEEILGNDELLSRSGVEPPVSLRVARALDLDRSPLTPEAFEQAVGHVKGDNKSSFNGNGKFGEAIVRVEGVTFCYEKEANVLENVSLTLREGEVHALVGSNAAGKTTLVKHIAGLLKPNQGKISICGEDIREKKLTDLIQKVGTVLQNPDEQLSERTVEEEIAFPLKQRQRKRSGLFSKSSHQYDRIQQQVSHVCELVGLEREILDRDPILLPRGLRKLVTIAEALVNDPKVLLFDEPTVSLGASEIQKLYQAIARLLEMGKTILLVENNIDFVAEAAHTVTLLERGQVVLQGDIREVFKEDNWKRLSELHIHPPQAARLAQKIGVQALTCDELVSQLSANRKEM